MLKNIYGNSKGYESIGIKFPEESNWLKSLKFIFSLIFISIIALIIYVFIRQYKSKKYLEQNLKIEQTKFQENKKNSLKDFTDILPKIDGNKAISNVDELFKSRILYINEKNVTNEYIRFLRPINFERANKRKQISF